MILPSKEAARDPNHPPPPHSIAEPSEVSGPGFSFNLPPVCFLYEIMTIVSKLN